MKPADLGEMDRKHYNRVCYVGCFNGVSKSVQVLFNGVEAP